MSVIAHWIEQQGIHTVVIGLVKEHLQKIQPPRALWVPFELGRPLGAPGNSVFQTDVLTTALRMIELKTDSPVLIDYEHDDPGASTDDNWTAPLTDELTSVELEVQALRPHYQQHCVTRSRTSVGVSKISIADAAALIDSANSNGPGDSPREDISSLLMMRLAIDDLKAYYTEAALHNGSPSSRQLQDWFWYNTYLGEKLLHHRLEWMQSDNEKLAAVAAKFIVPHRWREA